MHSTTVTQQLDNHGTKRKFDGIVITKPKPCIRRFNLNDLLQASLPKNIDDKAAVLERAEEVFVMELKKQLLEIDKDAPIMIDASFLSIKQEDTCNAIIEFIEKTCVIEANFSDLNFEVLGKNKKLFTALAKKPSLTRLSFNCIDIAQDSLSFLLNELNNLRDDPSMSGFQLDFCVIRFIFSPNSSSLITSLVSIPTLQNLNLSRTDLLDVQLEELLIAVNSSSSLLHLNLSEASIITNKSTSEIFKLFASFVGMNTTLVSLNFTNLMFSFSPIFYNDNHTVFNALINNPNSSLEELNNSAPPPTLVLYSSLIRHNKLRTIAFYAPTPLTKDFTQFIDFTKALSKNTSLRHLTVTRDLFSLPLKFILRFKKAIFENRTLTTLEYLVTSLGTSMPDQLIKCFEYNHNKSIHTLILRNCYFSDTHANQLSEILEKQNNTLHKLDIDWKPLSEPVAARLKAALKKNENKLKTVQCGSVYYRFLFAHSIFKTNNPNHTVTQKRKDIKSSHCFVNSIFPVIKNHIMPLIHGQPLPVEDFIIANTSDP